MSVGRKDGIEDMRNLSLPQNQRETLDELQYVTKVLGNAADAKSVCFSVHPR